MEPLGRLVQKMNKVIYQAMMTGLVVTIIEKEVVFGKADAKEDVLKIVDMIEELDAFWNSSSELDSNSDDFHGLIDGIKKQYTAIGA